MIRRVALGLLLASFLCGAPAARAQDKPPPAVPTDALRLMEHWLDAQVAYDRVSTLAAGVVLGPTLVWQRGWGHVDAAGRIPVTADTPYSICSISKLFTSVVAMQQWEAGRLPLDEDVRRLWPALALPARGADDGPVTVRSLLTHSAGLPREVLAPSWPARTYEAPSRERILQDLPQQPAFLPPSERLQYSNLGMALLGELVAHTAGQPYEQVVAQGLLAPLGMANTRTPLDPREVGVRMPPGQGALRRDGSRAPLPPYNAGGLAPAAGYVSTVGDLARFASWQFRLRAQGGREVLRVATLKDMQRVQWTDPDGETTWGLGFSVSRQEGRTVVGHTGRCPGYESGFTVLPAEELAFVSMASAQGAGPYTRGMRQIVLKGLNLKPGPADLAQYAGRYDANPWVAESVIVPWGEGLAWLDLPSRDPAGDMTVLRRIDGDVFREVNGDGSLGAEVRFVRDAAGRVTAARQWNYETRRVGD